MAHAPAVAELGLGLEQLQLPDDDKPADPAAPSEQQLRLKALLDPLSADKLKAIVLALAATDDALLEECAAMAADDLANRKLFIRGLAWGTTDDGLRAAFAEYGEIAEGGVAVDRISGKSRGFGFVTFTTAAEAQSALREPAKLIDGRQTICNLASAGAQQRQPGGARAMGGGMVGAMGGMGGMAVLSPYGDGRGGGFGRGGGMPLSPQRMSPHSVGMPALGALSPAYERYLSSVYTGYAQPMMAPHVGYESLGR